MAAAAPVPAGYWIFAALALLAIAALIAYLLGAFESSAGDGGAGPIDPLRPSQPRSVQAAAGNGEATVSFLPPAYSGVSPGTGDVGKITTYWVIAEPSGIVSAGPASPVVARNLANGQTYRFYVVAFNDFGLASERSAASNAVTPANF